MEEYLGEMDCRYRSDSIMMRLLRSAMDKAHKKVQFKDGPIECLHERSKFYELAIIQIQGSLNLIQEETDSRIPESSREKMISDLMELQNLLRGRLKEMKVSIIEKDKELIERLENEFKLKQGLELKERELLCLRTSLELERMKSEGINDFLLGNRANRDEAKGGDICELKNSVDQQVWNIKQRLEDERINLTSGMKKIEPDSELFEEGRSLSTGSKEELYGEDEYGSNIKPLTDSLRPEQNVVIEQMSSDIDILKGTLDLAFGRMQNVELRPLEKQWRWTIEKETISILMRGFMSDLKQNFEAEFKKNENYFFIGLSNEHWSELIDEMTRLRGELEVLFSRNEVRVKRIRGHDDSSASPNVRRTSSEPLPEVDYMEDLPEEDQIADGSHYVAKMIKNHESIIRKQHEELHWFKGEVLRGKRDLSVKREKDIDNLERRTREVIVRLDNVIKWKDKLGAKKHDSRGKRMISKPAIPAKEKRSIGHDADLNDEIRKLKQEIDDSHLPTTAMEETYIIFFKGLVKDFGIELYDYNIESSVREDVSIRSFREMINEWNLSFDNKSMETQIREEIYYIVCNEAVKDFGCNHCFASVEYQNDQDEGNEEDLTSSNSLLQYWESTLREDVFAEFFQEMVKEWNNSMENHATESLVKEEIYRIVFDETVKYIESTANLALSQYKEVRGSDNFLNDFPCTRKIPETIESLLKEDVYMVFLREMVKAWKMERDAYNIENLIREDIFQFVIVKAVKDAHVFLSKTEVLNQDSFSEDVCSAKNLDESSEVSGEENLIQKIDSLLKTFEVEKDLMLRASFEVKEHSAHRDLAILESDELDERTTNEWLLTEDESAITSVSNKLEKALQQLVTSKEVSRELENSSGEAVDDSEKVHDEINTIVEVVHERENSFCQPKNNQMVQLSPSDSVFSPFIGFQQVLSDFEHMVHEKLERNHLRLEEVKHQIAPLVQLSTSLSKREFLYKKAFVRRCHNLQLAETEVDLLGDQVDVLVGLLEKIYLILDEYSPVLSHYFGVLDILKLIKKELTRGAACTPNL